MAGSFGPANRTPMQSLTYWAPGAAGYDGEPDYVAPVAIQGRWTEIRSEIQGPNGEQLVSKTTVIVDRDLEEGGYLARGLHLGEALPTAFDEAYEIQGFTSTPDLRFMEQVRRAYL